MTKSDDYLWDRSGEPDADVARLETLLSPLAHEAPLDERGVTGRTGKETGEGEAGDARARRNGDDELRLRRRRKRMWIVVSSVVVAAAAAVLLVVLRPRPTEPGTGAACIGFGFTFSAHDGTVSCNGAALATGVLPVGGTLDTGAQRAELAIADIGEAQLGVDTVVQLERAQFGATAQTTRHQLRLERGHMHAKVNAPPKIFAVTTPSADVTDLGCEYTLDLDRTGAGAIRVISGKVELEAERGRSVVLLAGMHARLLPGRRAGVALSDKAGPAMEQAAAALDAGNSDGLARVLAAATRDDAITLQRLARTMPPAQARPVLEKLQTLIPIPQGTTLDEALADNALLEMWLDEVELVFIGASH